MLSSVAQSVHRNSLDSTRRRRDDTANDAKRGRGVHSFSCSSVLSHFARTHTHIRLSTALIGWSHSFGEHVVASSHTPTQHTQKPACVCNRLALASNPSPEAAGRMLYYYDNVLHLLSYVTYSTYTSSDGGVCA